MALSDIRPTAVVSEEGGQINFSGDQPPKGPSAKSDMDITKVGTKHTPYEEGSDSYVGIPGDGVVPR